MPELTLRPIRPTDDPILERLIKTVMPEFGAGGAGFAINDPQVACFHATYSAPRTYYLVAERNGEVLGGGGITPLAGGEPDTCELNKMYLFKEGRGLGLGNRLLIALLEKAKELGFKRCYLETLERMDSANHLYNKFGFKQISQPMGATGHFSCDKWYVKDLRALKALDGQ